MISLDSRDVSMTADAATRRELRRRFAADRFLRLPALIGDSLLATVQRRLTHARFSTRVADRVFPPAIDLKLQDEDLHGLLHFVLNDRAVLDFVREIADVPEATGYVGAVYRLEPGMGHSDSWHSDLDGNRLVGLTVNLSDGLFEGGELEMRDRESERRLWRVANTGPGDGLLFALGPDLQHCIQPMTGTVAKTAFAGWFCRDADLKL